MTLVNLWGINGRDHENIEGEIFVVDNNNSTDGSQGF